MSARNPFTKYRSPVLAEVDNPAKDRRRALAVHIKDVVDYVEIVDGMVARHLFHLGDDILRGTQPCRLAGKGIAVSAQERTTPAGEQDALPPVVIGITQMLLVAAEIDHAVVRERQFV